MDGRVSVSLRGPEGLPFFPAIAESLKTRGRIVPLLSCIPDRHQCNLDQRIKQGAKTCVLRQPGTSWCRREVPIDGEARLRFSYSSPQAQVILLTLHGDRPD